MDSLSISDQVIAVKTIHENTRQSIGCLVTVLNTGIKKGGEYTTEIEYAIADPRIREEIEAKIRSLIQKL